MAKSNGKILQLIKALKSTGGDRRKIVERFEGQQELDWFFRRHLDLSDFKPVTRCTTESAVCEKSGLTGLRFRLTAVFFIFAMPGLWHGCPGKEIKIQTDPVPLAVKP